MKIRGIVFDKDGTLLDFYKTWIPAYREAARLVCESVRQPDRSAQLLSSTGLEVDTDYLTPGSPLACESNSRIAEIWSALLEVRDTEPVLQLLEKTFDTTGAARAEPVPELAPLLTRLRARGLLLGLATMDSEALAHATLDRFGVSHLFSFVCGYDSGYGQKPEPGMIYGFCESTSLKPDECLMVGDTPHDLRMGTAAGVAMTVGVLTGASEHHTLSHLADRVVPDIRDLEEIIEGMS